METTRVILMSKDYLINFTVSPLHLVLWLSESVVFLSFSDWLCHHCGDPALLLPSFLLLDVSWGSPAVPHACRSLWERILAEKVLLRVWLPLPRHRCRRLSSYWLQELRDQESVSAASFFLSLWKHSWKCRADMLDAALCGLTCCGCVWQILKRNPLVISASTLCASLETTPKHLSAFCQGWAAVQFFMSFESGWQTQHCGFRGGCSYINAFLFKDPPVTSCL